MATNDFIPFCPTDTGTNLESQADYIADPDRTIGNQPGIASSKLNNKALRQGTFITSQFAQYLSNRLNANVNDDGNTAALQAQIVSTLAPNDGFAIENLTLAVSVAGNALTIAVKTAAAANASATDPIFVGFRSSTLTSGVFNRRSIAAALSLVVSSGSTLGQLSGVPGVLSLYLIDNAGTPELAISGTRYAEDALVSTTAEGGAGAADSLTTIYSTTSRSNVPMRFIGYMVISEVSAGSWALGPTQIQLAPYQRGVPVSNIQLLTSGTSWVAPANISAQTVLKFTVVGGGGQGGGSGAGAFSGGSGGGGGGIGVLVISGLSPGTTYTYAIGAAGSGAGTAASGTAGGNTTLTINGVTYTAVGGPGGLAGNSAALTWIGAPASGGTSGAFTWVGGFAGSQGIALVSGNTFGGTGGAGPWGGAGIGAQGVTSANGGAAFGYGAGGGGANQGTKAGGAGGSGCILIEWVA